MHTKRQLIGLSNICWYTNLSEMHPKKKNLRPDVYIIECACHHIELDQPERNINLTKSTNFQELKT